MNVEPQTHGLSDWQFPSPSSTPRSSAFEQAPFATPKCEPSTHFLDAYYTPQQATGHQTPASTPVTQQFAFRKPTSTRNSPLTPHDPHFHVNHYKEGHLPLPPVDPARLLSSSPDLIQSSGDLQQTISASAVRLKGPMDSFQMQTPPPTRDSSSRRDFENGQQHGLPMNQGQMYPPGPTSHTPIRPAPPMMHHTPQFHTPVPQFSQAQFSSGMFQYPNNGPASAPAMPHARFSWDTQSPSYSFANEAMMSSQQDAFGPPHPISPGYAQWHTPMQQQLMPQPMPQQGGYQAPYEQPQQQHADFWTTPAMGSQPGSSFNQNDSFVSTTTSVNPSMIFSFTSPSELTDPSPIRQNITPQKIDTTGRLPYEHQMRESSREKELFQKSKQTHSRSSTGSGAGSLGKSSLQRSNTDSGARRPKFGFAETQRAGQIIEQVERRASPLKRHSQLSLNTIPEAMRARPKTRLVIGDDGRARTETVGANDDAQDSRQGFGIWDEDSSDDDQMTSRSQRNSYGANPDQLQRRPSKHARIDSDSDRYDGLSRPVSSTSISSLTSRLETTPIGKRSSREFQNRRLSAGNLSASANKIANFVKAEENEDDTNAQAALRRVMEGRSKRSERDHPQILLNAHNQRWSQASIDVAKFSAVQEQGGSYDPFASAGSTSLSPTSGTDLDILTPSTEHSSRSNESTRCVCNTNDDGHLMVQCESCNKWLHVQCVGLNAQCLPPVYVCVFCTGTTPLARGGRIREPLRRGDQAHASPLGYKSANMFQR